MPNGGTAGLSGGGNPKQVMQFRDFRGVDYSDNPLEMSSSRSPDMMNMLPYKNGSIASRNGYSKVFECDGSINGIYSLIMLEEKYHLVHHGTKLSIWNIGAEGTEEDPLFTDLTDEMNNKKSVSAQFGNRIYILDGMNGWVFGEFDEEDENGELTGEKVYELHKMVDKAYVPLALIQASPGEMPGGTTYENVNLLTPKRRNRFIITSSGRQSDNTYKTELYLSSAPISSDVTLKYLNNSIGEWVDFVGSYTVNTARGIVTITSEMPVTQVVGADNFEVEFSNITDDGKSGYSTFGFTQIFWDRVTKPEHTQKVTSFRNIKGFDNPNTTTANEWVTRLGQRDVFQTTFKSKNVEDISGINLVLYGLEGFTAEIKVPTADGVWYRTKYRQVGGTTTHHYERPMRPDEGTGIYEGTYDVTDKDDYYVFARAYQDDDDMIIQYTAGIIFHETDTTADYKDMMIVPDATKIIFGETNEYSYSDRVNKATICTKFGYAGNMDRLFVAGYESMREYEFWSEYNNPLYFPDLNYACLGDQDTAVMGWSRINNNQMAIHKSDNGQDSTFFIQSAEEHEIGGLTNYTFPVKEGAVGEGVISQRAFGVLNGEPLALSSKGVFATKYVEDVAADVRYSSPRSFYIEPELQKYNLSQAEAIIFKNKYWLAIGEDKVFVADGNQKYMIGGNEGYNMSYEWFPLDNIPVRVWWSYEGNLYFGTTEDEDGKSKLYMFDETYMDDDVPVECYWTTNQIDFGTEAYNKKVKNVVLTCPPPRTEFSEVNIDYLTNKQVKEVKSALIDNTDGKITPFSISTNYKAKKIQCFQVRVRANNGEDFAIGALNILYTISGKFKG